MTIAEYTNKIDQLIQQLEKEVKPLKIAVLSVNALRMKRIFQDGLNSNNSKIGTYNSSTPIYVSDNQAPKKVNHKGKTGKPIKSGYYDSYKDFRAAMGRESDFVNLRLTNDLQSDLSNSPVTGDSVGKFDNLIKVNAFTYKVALKRDINIKKKQGLEKKYGPVFAHTAFEKGEYNKILSAELRSLVGKYL